MKKIPITVPYLSNKESEAAARVVRSKWVNQGPMVEQFEQAVSRFVKSKYAVATSSGTSALHIALLLAGIKPNDEVILPSFTFIATVNNIIHLGAVPVFVDIDPKTYNLDPKKVEECINHKIRNSKFGIRNLKAIMPVHQIGLPAEMKHILKTAKKYNLRIIEDAACALGAEYNGKKIGSISGLTCFSFHPRKIITTGEGGMITTDNKNLYEKAKSYRSHGVSGSGEYNIPGFNYRMTDIQAAIGIEQMKKLKNLITKRVKLAERYNKAFENIKHLVTPYVPAGTKHIYQSYMLRIKQNSQKTRDAIMGNLEKKGIAVRKISAVHMEPYYRKNFRGTKLPVTELCHKNTLILPLYPEMTEKEQNYIIQNLKSILK
ncbi:MAG: DegT/DnrJ/EryC1/StrS family aminotransferase [Elusimicrobia bacterium]|nr:DegT/DnrJ/EryC1/StrS family aminotransferase [Elusimicrobiota bacterium]